eukprot:TRINITY_DN425_c0_g1_i1.p1 TRINITY_DN425_c0_g1~~TRINITY_DN425_c0_g1_i1.p1  ORF type:complete len:871 (+),score=389.51 TRINITY_DN425_c0_g1_i1:92-2704(+)
MNEDPAVKKWLESWLEESLCDDLFDALQDGTKLCKLTKLMLPSYNIVYEQQPPSRWHFRKNIEAFMKACEFLNIPIYITPADVFAKRKFENLTAIICSFGTAALSYNDSDNSQIGQNQIDDQNQSNEYYDDQNQSNEYYEEENQSNEYYEEENQSNEYYDDQNQTQQIFSKPDPPITNSSLTPQPKISTLNPKDMLLQTKKQQSLLEVQGLLLNRQGSGSSLPINAALPTQIDSNTAEMQKIEKQKRMQQMVLKEIIQTEKGYSKDLELLLRKFINPISAQQILSSEDVKKIFLNTKDILVCALKISKEIEKDSDIINIANQFIQKKQVLIDLYTSYCCEHDGSLEYLERCRKKEKRFDTFLKNLMEDQELRCLDLNAFLVKPVQRVCKYPLLFRELLKNTPDTETTAYQLIANALSVAEEITSKVNNNKRGIENRLFLERLQQSIFTWNEDLSIQRDDRFLIKEGNLQKFSKVNELLDRKVILFTDVIVFLKERKSGGLEICAWVPLDLIAITDVPDNNLLQNTFFIARTDSKSKIFARAQDPAEKTAWLNALRTTIQNWKNMKSVETSSFESVFGLGDHRLMKLIEARKRIITNEDLKFISFERKITSIVQTNRYKINNLKEPKLTTILLFNDAIYILIPLNKENKNSKKLLFEKIIYSNVLAIAPVIDTEEISNAIAIASTDTKKANIYTLNTTEEKLKLLDELAILANKQFDTAEELFEAHGNKKEISKIRGLQRGSIASTNSIQFNPASIQLQQIGSASLNFGNTTSEFKPDSKNGNKLSNSQTKPKPTSIPKSTSTPKPAARTASLSSSSPLITSKKTNNTSSASGGIAARTSQLNVDISSALAKAALNRPGSLNFAKGKPAKK